MQGFTVYGIKKREKNDLIRKKNAPKHFAVICVLTSNKQGRERKRADKKS